MREGREACRLASADPDVASVSNAGNEIELIVYPKLGDHIYSQARYSDIKGRVTKDGVPMLVVTTETTYTNQNGDGPCILRASGIRR